MKASDHMLKPFKRTLHQRGHLHMNRSGADLGILKRQQVLVDPIPLAAATRSAQDQPDIW